MRILIRPRPTEPSASVIVRPAVIRVPTRQMRVLSLDCEARPMHWIANDYVSKEITAIAWAWCDAPDNVTCYTLGETDPVEMLERFRAVYDYADMVTGHYMRGFDLPLIQGAMTEYGLQALGDKLSQDTKIDLIKRHGLSGSQENIGAMLHLEHPKIQMNQKLWRDANRLTPGGLAILRRRVIGDVQQQIEMRRRLLELGYLGPAVVWKSGAAEQEPKYTP